MWDEERVAMGPPALATSNRRPRCVIVQSAVAWKVGISILLVATLARLESVLEGVRTRRRMLEYLEKWERSKISLQWKQGLLESDAAENDGEARDDGFR